MNQTVEIKADQTIHLYLDMSVYPKAAVMKVLGRWTDRYAVMLERSERLHVFFQPLVGSERTKELDAVGDSQAIINELLQELLRLEIIAQTSGIRQLLVSRALYATCIEACPEDTQAEDLVGEPGQGWEADSRRILTSWNG